MALTQDGIPYGENDDWTRFGVGSWKLVRLYTETVDGDGLVESTSTQEVRLTFDKLEETRYVLKVEVTVEAAGKRFEAVTKYMRRGFHGETNGQHAQVRRKGDAAVEVAGRKIPTEVHEVIVQGKDLRRTQNVFYSPTVPPFVLQRDAVVTDRESKVESYKVNSKVIAIEMPYKVLSQTKTTSFLHTVQEMASGEETITFEVYCPDIPGGVISHSAKSLDRNGQVIQRSTLELLDYEAPARARTSQVNGRRRFFVRGRRKARQ
jgi:hypothetical protein